MNTMDRDGVWMTVRVEPFQFSCCFLYSVFFSGHIHFKKDKAD